MNNKGRTKEYYREYNKQYQREYFKKHPEKYLLWGIRYRCRKKNIPFDLTEEDIVIPEFCPALGIPLYRNRGGKKHTDNSPSVDRIVPELGYVKGNIQIISQKANTMKTNATLKELKDFANWVLRTY